jgi:hypothetical protein
VAYEWAAEEYERLPPIVQDARRLLEDWFRAMEAGEVTRRMPDPVYPARIDMQVVDQMIDHIDREFEKELRAWAGLEAAGGYTEGPGFSRLKPAQRLALAQQLHALKLKHAPAPQAASTPAAASAPVSG